MKDPIFVVTQQEYDTARWMETKLVESGPVTGILFAGVSIEKKSETHAEYRVSVGCRRDWGGTPLDVRAIGMAAAVVLKEGAYAGTDPMVFIEVFRGITLGA